MTSNFDFSSQEERKPRQLSNAEIEASRAAVAKNLPEGLNKIVDEVSKEFKKQFDARIPKLIFIREGIVPGYNELWKPDNKITVLYPNLDGSGTTHNTPIDRFIHGLLKALNESYAHIGLKFYDQAYDPLKTGINSNGYQSVSPIVKEIIDEVTAEYVKDFRRPAPEIKAKQGQHPSSSADTILWNLLVYLPTKAGDIEAQKLASMIASRLKKSYKALTPILGTPEELFPESSQGEDPYHPSYHSNDGPGRGF